MRGRLGVGRRQLWFGVSSRPLRRCPTRAVPGAAAIPWRPPPGAVVPDVSRPSGRGGDCRRQRWSRRWGFHGSRPRPGRRCPGSSAGGTRVRAQPCGGRGRRRISALGRRPSPAPARGGGASPATSDRACGSSPSLRRRPAGCGRKQGEGEAHMRRSVAPAVLAARPLAERVVTGDALAAQRAFCPPIPAADGE